MTSITHAISAALLHFVWQGLVVALLLWVVLATLRNASSWVRYIAGCAALVIMIALPIATAWVIYQTSIAAGVPSDRPIAISYSAAEPLPSASLLSVLIAVIEAWAFPVWCAGVLIFAVRLMLSSRHVARLRREGHPAEVALIDRVACLARRMSISRSVRVLISRLADSPSVAGWLRPVILLPAATLLSLSAEQLEAVLAHELAHVRRHDYLVNMLQTFAETLLFYQPAVWWVSSRIRNERELCCDDLAVKFCGDPIDYARALTKLERLRVISPELAMSSTAGPLLYRIQRLTGVAEEQPPSKLPPIFALGLALICLMTNLHQAHAQPQTGREAEVRRDAIWVDTAKYGDLSVMVRALGTVTAPGTVELEVPASVASPVQIGQSATIELRRGVTIAGKVRRVESSIVNGTVTAVVELQAPVPEFVSQPVDGTVRIRTLSNVVYVGRPVDSQAESEATLFKIESDGSYAKRVKVRFGASSVNNIQILEGLQPGDRVILSDMFKYNGSDRIKLE